MTHAFVKANVEEEENEQRYSGNGTNEILRFRKVAAINAVTQW